LYICYIKNEGNRGKCPTKLKEMKNSTKTAEIGAGVFIASTILLFVGLVVFMAITQGFIFNLV